MKRLLTLFFLWLGTLNGWAQAPSPAQMGITTATPNAVQVLDSSKNWATIGTVDPTTHLFSPANIAGSLPPLVTSFNTRIGAVTLSSSDVTGALGFTPYDAANPANYIAAAGAPVQSVAGRTGAVTLTHSDITDWTATLLPYALLNSPTFTGTPSLPTGTTGVTQSPGDSSTKLATTAFVGAAGAAGTGTIIANTTPTSGFAASQMLYSDGSKVQQSGITATGAGAMSAGTVNASNFIIPSVAVIANNLGGNFSLLSATNPSIVAVGSYSPTTNPTSLRVYNTFTDASNGEWGGFDWQTTPNVLTIGAQANGTGTQRSVKIISGGFGGQGSLDYSLTANGFWTVYGYYGIAPPNSGGTYLGFTGKHWYNIYTDGITIGPSELAGVTCAAGQASVSTLGIITTCAAPTYPYTVAGTVTSGGIPYFSSATQISSSAVLTNNAVMIGKGAGAAPATTTTPTASAFISNGTKPTLTTGTCSGSSGAGGATAGTFVLVGICAAAGTVILTALPAATTGYACDMEDRVTRAATIVQSAATTTSATFIMGSTPSVANDVFQFKCTGY